MSQASPPAGSGASALVLPVPTLPFAMVVGLVDIFLLAGLSMTAGFSLGSPIVIAANVIGSLVIYGALLCLLAGGDPRLWRHPEQLRLVLASDRSAISDSELAQARAMIWQSGSVVMGRQAGCLAGLIAAAGLSLQSEMVAIIGFLIVGGAVWLLVSMAVSLPDRAELAPWLDQEDRPESAPDIDR